MMRRLYPPLMIAVILLLAAGLRFHQLEAQSFWNDEGNSARLSERTIPLIIEGTASDIHPPLYYLLLRGWREPLGETEFALRGLSAFVGVLTVAAAMALGRLLGGWRAGYGVGVFTAVSPPLIYYSQEARMYALLALLALLSTLALLRWLQSDNGGRWAAAYVGLAAAGLYTHYFFPAVLLVHNLLFGLMWLRLAGVLLFFPLRLVGKRPLAQMLRGWVGMMAMTLILYLPWLPIFIRQAGGRGAIRPPLATFLGDAGRWLLFGATAVPTEVRLAGWAAVCLLLLVIWRRWRQVWLGATATAVLVLFMWLAGTTDPAFYKFLTAAVPFLWLTVAVGLLADRRTRLLPEPPEEPRFPGRQRPNLLNPHFLSIFLLLPVGYGLILSLVNLYTDPAFARADYRGMAQRIEADNHPDAAVILNAPNQWEVFTYYFADTARVYPLPRGNPDAAEIDAELAAITAEYDRLYAIFWGEAQRDPERLVERWLDAHAFKATDEWIGDVRFVRYAVVPDFATEMVTAVSARFGADIVLQGYTVGRTAVSAGDVVPLTLFWETERPLTTRYKVFLHVVNSDGVLVTQRDSEPGGGLNLTTNWSPEETIVDNHGVFIPNDLPPGRYTLLLGLYELTNPAARLLLPDGSDSMIIDEIEVR